jgi:type I restriction enzyme S subunit
MSEIVDMKESYKLTPIGKIPKEWELIELGDLFYFKNGVNADISAYGNGIKFINVMEVIYNNKITHTIIPGSITLDEKQITPNLVKYGDVLFNRTSETKEDIGLTAVYLDTSETVFGGFVIRGRSKNSVLDNEFKKDCFRSSVLRKQIIARGQGAVRTNIGQKDLEKVLFPLPPLPEQQKIAEILSTWDQAISTSQKLIDKLKLRNKGLSQQLLTGKKRLKGFEGEWEEQQLEHYFKERKESNHPDLPLLSVGEIGVYPQTNSNKKDSSNEDKSKYKRICPGDIGYNTMRMWQGRSALSSLEGIVSPAYTIVTPKKNADALFFAYLFKLDEVIHKFFRNSQGMVSDTLNCKFKDFKIVKVLTPLSIDEQKAITKVLQKAYEELKLYEQELKTLKEQKKGLMQKLLTGEIRVNYMIGVENG